MDKAAAWLLGVVAELGLADHPDWIHVALVLGEPIRGQVTTPRAQQVGFTLDRQGFECEDDARVPGIESGRVELFGLEVDLSRPQRRPLWALTMPDHTALVVEPWRRYAFPHDTRLFAQVDWRSEGQELASIHGGELDAGRSSDADYLRARAVQAALLRLRDVKLRRGGRRRGSLKGRVWTRRDCLDWYAEAGQAYANDSERVTLKDLGDAMGVSDDTARTRLRSPEINLPWPPDSFPESWDPDD